MQRHPILFFIFLLNISILVVHGLNCHAFSLWLNLSSSLPYGVYRLSPMSDHNNIKRNDLVLFCLQKNIAKKTLAPKYLDNGNCELGLAPIGKRIIAVPGDIVTVNDSGIYINGLHIKNSARNQNLRGKNYVNFDRQMLLNDEFIVASELTDSYDSRYFGIIHKKDIKGTLQMVLVQKKS